MSFRLARRATTLALTGVLSLGAVVFAASAAPANATASVQLANVYTDTCLDAANWGRGINGVVTLVDCSEGASVGDLDYYTQHWQVVQYSGYVQIVLTQWPYMCLDGVEGTDGITVQQCKAGDLHQRWYESNVEAYINTFENTNNFECLDGTYDYGARVMPCLHADDHQWWA